MRTPFAIISTIAPAMYAKIATPASRRKIVNSWASVPCGFVSIPVSEIVTIER